MKVLVVEDNPSLSRNLVTFLWLKDISTQASMDGKDALYRASTEYFDAIVLDINLPEMDGIEVCKSLREKQKDTPIIMLTSRSMKSDVIEWLEAGADDYLTKPFDYDILVTRLRALTRRNLKNKSNTFIYIGDYTIDVEKVEVSRWDDIIKLSKLEYTLFKYLAQNNGRAVDRKELYEKVWGEFDWDFMFSKTVDVYIWYLRKKLDREIIETKKWIWYMINK